jgi:predicted nuclease of predicted toxin-antitoxin system
VAHVILDENVQKSLAELLRDAGHTAERAVEAGLVATPDEDIFAYAQQLGAVVITRDTTFVDATDLPPDHGGVILLRFPNLMPTEEVNEEVMTFLTKEISLDDMRGRFVVLEPGGRARFRDPER